MLVYSGDLDQVIEVVKQEILYGEDKGGANSSKNENQNKKGQ